MVNPSLKFAKILLFFWTLLFLQGLLALAQTNALDCLENIQKAVDTGDSEAFEQLVAIDDILNQAMDVFLQEIGKPENTNIIPPLLALPLSHLGNSEAFRKLLLKEMRTFALNGIASGAFGGKSLTPHVRQGILAPLFAGASLGKKEITFIGAPEQTENGWLIPFITHDHGNNNDYGIMGLFQLQNNAWRMTAIQNLPELFAQIMAEANAQ